MFLHNNEMLQSICWTLVHSLWQGIVLAMLAGMVIVFTRKTSAVMRYNLLAFLGLAFILCVGITFYLQIQTNEPATFQSQRLESSQDASSPVLVTYNNQDLQQQRQTVIGSVAGFLDHNAPYIVAIWLVVFLFKCVQLIRGLRQIHHLRHHQLSSASDYWNDRLDQLKKLLHVNGQVLLKESPLIKTPAVVGFFKPMILLPLGMLANVPTAEAEAILLHELAHIRRKDYLANLVQGFGEIVFFYNPGFIWVSSVIKTERENCCDDMAVAITQSKAGFVSALVLSQEYGWNNNRLVLGFGRKKTPLLDRAKRILQNNNQSLNNTEKTLLSLCVVLGLCMTIAFNSKGQSEDSVLFQDKQTTGTPSQVSYADRVYHPADYAEGTALQYTDQLDGYTQTTYLFKYKGVLYQVTGDIRLLKVNGQNIPQENWKQYLPIIHMLTDSYRQHGRIVYDADAPEDSDDTEEEESMEVLSALDALAPLIPSDAPDFPVPPAPPAPPFAPIAPVAPASPVDLASFDLNPALAMAFDLRYDSLKKKLSIDMKKLTEEIRKAELAMQHAVDKDAQESDALHQALVRDLKSALGTEIGSYGLTRTKLIVNAKAQSSKLQQQMADKYLKKYLDMSYHYDIKTGRVFDGRTENEIRKSNDVMHEAEMELKKAELEMRRADMEMAKAEIEMARSEAEYAKAELERERIETEEYRQETNLPSAILKDLKEKLGNVTVYELNEKELIVNGKKQSADLHRQLSKKYIKGKMSVKYSCKNGSKSTSISKED